MYAQEARGSLCAGVEVYNVSLRSSPPPHPHRLPALLPTARVRKGRALSKGIHETVVLTTYEDHGIRAHAADGLAHIPGRFMHAIRIRLFVYSFLIR